MIIEIKDKEYEVHFGIAFVRAVDEKYSTGAGNVKYGTGVETYVGKLMTGDVVALADIIFAGTASEKVRPTQKLIDQYIDEVEDIDALFTEVLDELKKQNATKKRALAAASAVEAQQKQ